MGFPGGSGVKNPPANAGDVGSIPAWVGKMPWRRKRQPTPIFFLGHPMDRGGGQATVHRVRESDTYKQQVYICQFQFFKQIHR